MARPIYIPNSELPFHVTARACNKTQYPVPIDELWKIMCGELALSHYLYNLKIHSFVLMPNHFHLIVQTPDANLSDAMRSFMLNISKAINASAGKINQNHGSRYFRCLIQNELYYRNTYKYVFRNPVTAGLSLNVESYSYSSIQMLLGLQTIKLPLEQDSHLLNDIDDTLKWLNSAPQEEDRIAVKCALRKSIFMLPYNRKIRKPNRLENQLL